MSITLLNNIFGKMAEVNLALSKEIIAITEDRDTAEVLAMDIRDEIQNYISVGRSGDPDLPYAVKGVPYLKYVNGYDRENFGGGFVDAAVDSTMSSGYGDIEVMV